MDKFGFIAHPINVTTFRSCISPWSFLERVLYQEPYEKILMRLLSRKFCIFNKIRSSQGVIIKGDMFTIPLMPAQIVSLPEDFVLGLIERCIKRCEIEGAKLVGLGGFTSVVGNEGEVLSKRVKIPLTSGNTFTAAMALEGIYKAVYVMGLFLPEVTVAVIGATGDIGSICTRLLSKKVKRMNIVARNEKKLLHFANEIKEYGNAKIIISKCIRDAVKEADVVLTVTSSIATIIDPIDLKPGAIICDVAIPANIAKEAAQFRNDILVFEGGLAKIQNPEDMNNKKISIAMPFNGIYGCLAETMALTFENRFEPFSIGRGNITEEKILEIKNIAARHGITVSDFFCGYKFFKEKDIENIRKNAERNKEKMYAIQK